MTHRLSRTDVVTKGEEGAQGVREKPSYEGEMRYEGERMKGRGTKARGMKGRDMNEEMRDTS